MARPCTIRCCSASGCRSAGSAALQEALEAAGELAAAAGDATAAPQVKAVGCLRLCGLGPLVAVDAADGT